MVIGSDRRVLQNKPVWRVDNWGNVCREVKTKSQPLTVNGQASAVVNCQGLILL